jgi:uncharacterized protein
VRDRTPINLLLASLEKGEAKVLCLAKDLKVDLLLLDEEKARRSATLAGFEVMGTVGFLLLAKELELIKEVRFSSDELQRNDSGSVNKS